MRFAKYHALGNDYLVITPQEAGDLPHQPEAVQRLCHRNFGIGSDGILIGPIPSPETQFGLRIFNPDGSEAEKSGNGIRIFSRWLWDHKFVTKKPFQIGTQGGTVNVEMLDEGQIVKVEMGPASFDSQVIPVTGSNREVVNEILEVAGGIFHYCAVTIGNPHCVIRCDRVSTQQVKELGPLIEKDPRFPNRTNVQLMEIRDQHHIYIEIWERGAGYTLASGSSSCAAAVAAVRLGLCQSPITVLMPGGSLEIQIKADNHIIMVGGVTRVAEGEIFDEIFSDKIYPGGTQQ
jgi:diaminopimelate epimerase